MPIDISIIIIILPASHLIPILIIRTIKLAFKWVKSIRRKAVNKKTNANQRKMKKKKKSCANCILYYLHTYKCIWMHSPQNGSVSNVTWSPDGTIYAQIDQAKRHSVAGAVPLNAAITAASPPSGYVRLPPVDHFHLIPYADTSSSSPSPSQYSGLTQQVDIFHSFILFIPFILEIIMYFYIITKGQFIFDLLTE